ncbi:MAG: protein-L-isoaspartate(D-aspartate) O-methyltransferase [Deltaproteobacteria bacterium]|nr:protein-L-isoaspartate(D-aspartate) O-methyltransferase [Deltaproteobacteria bacterium]
MVREQIESRGVDDPAVLAAMRRVPRDRFLPEDRLAEAHGDYPVQIGHGQTISQPYIVAIMSELARVEPGDRVLEVGTGSGYQAAILAEMGARVWTIEIVEPLAKSAAQLLRDLGYDDVTVRHGDGYAGWPEEAPFDAIVLTAAPLKIPQPLLDQLAPRGRLVAPVGRFAQELVVVTRGENGLEYESVLGVRFVPMTGAAQQVR